MIDKKVSFKKGLIIFAIVYSVLNCTLLAQEQVPTQQSVLISYSLVPSLLMSNIVTLSDGSANNAEAINISVMPSIISSYRLSSRD